MTLGYTILDLARTTVEMYTKEGKIPVFHSDKDFEDLKINKKDYEELQNMRAGCFVTLYKDDLRGCIGTILPYQDNLADEIIHNAVSACSMDPRFPPVRVEELTEINYSVDILDKPERIETANELNVKKYGVIVSTGSRKGLLLPNLPGVDTIEKQLSIALQKANINPSEVYEMERFRVRRYEEGI